MEWTLIRLNMRALVVCRKEKGLLGSLMGIDCSTGNIGACIRQLILAYTSSPSLECSSCQECLKAGSKAFV